MIMVGWDNIYAVMGRKEKQYLERGWVGFRKEGGDIWFCFLFLFLGAAK
jgi:hypothetical protein